MKIKKYKEPLNEEMETTINVLYDENLLSIYTNKVSLQKKLHKFIGEPHKEYMIKNKISGSVWEIPLDDKIKINNIFFETSIF